MASHNLVVLWMNWILKQYLPTRPRQRKSRESQSDIAGSVSKELRLKVCTMEDGNVYLPEYMEEFNSAFSVVPRSSIDMHRPLTNTDDLDAILVQQQERILSKQLTLSYGRHIYQIETDHPTYAMRHARVIVREANSGAISIHYHGKSWSIVSCKNDQKQQLSTVNISTTQWMLQLDRCGQSHRRHIRGKQPQMYW